MANPLSIRNIHDTKDQIRLEQNGNIYCQSLDVTGNALVEGNLIVTGSLTGSGLQPSGDTTGVKDTANLNALVSLAAAGSTINLGPGQFWFSSKIIGRANVTIQGAGIAGETYGNGFTSSTILSAIAGFTDTAVLMLDGSSAPIDKFGLRNIVLDGSSITSGASAGIEAIGQVTGLVWENVTVSKFYGPNIVLAASGSNYPNGTFRNVTSWYSGNSDGWQVAVRDSQLYACMSFGNAGYGWNFTLFSDTTFTLCRAEHNELQGFYANSIVSTGNIIFTACTTDQNNYDGFYLGALTGIGAVQVSGCGFRRDGNNAGSGSSTYSGIVVTDCTSPVTINGTAVQAQAGDSSLGIGPHYGLTVSGSSFVSVNGGYYGYESVHSGGRAFNWDGTGAFTLGGAITIGVNSGGAYPGAVTDYRAGEYMIIKPSNTSVTSNNTPAADPALTTTLPPNSQFAFHMGLFMDGPTSSAAEFQAGMTTPGSATTTWVLFGLQSTAAGSSANLFAQASVLTSSTRTVGLAGIGIQTFAVMDGVIKTTNAGTFALNWAQGVSNGTATTLYANSSLALRQIQ